MQFTQRERPYWDRWRPLLAIVPVGLLLGFAGPFGSYPAFPTATRYAFWLAMTAVGVMAAVAADALLPRTRFRIGGVRIVAVALVSALPMTFVVAWTMSFVQPGRFFAPQQMMTLSGAVAAVQLLIVYATMTIESAAPSSRVQAPPDASRNSTPAAFPSALLNRLPRGIGSDIIALETEDHYLRIHTAGGSALVLMRMADAVAMLDPRLGAQVHRRWWVAEAAVSGLRTEGHKLLLSLGHETLVPVGRTFAAATRARFGSAPSPG